MVLVFDLNGTLLDSQAVQPAIAKIFGRNLTATQYFNSVLQYATALTLVGEYRPFGAVADAVLRMKAESFGIKLTERSSNRVSDTLRRLPAFPEVPKALAKLQKAKLRLVVLTNSSSDAMRQQLVNAGLLRYFERAISVSEVERFKPAGETYAFAARELGVPPEQILMVAAHPWDLMGAGAAGCQTAFLRRPGQALFPLAAAPSYTASDLTDLTRQLLHPFHSARSHWRPVLAAATAVGVVAGGLYFREQSRSGD